VLRMIGSFDATQKRPIPPVCIAHGKLSLVSLMIRLAGEPFHSRRMRNLTSHAVRWPPPVPLRGAVSVPTGVNACTAVSSGLAPTGQVREDVVYTDLTKGPENAAAKELLKLFRS
jgi:hypothetical protein